MAANDKPLKFTSIASGAWSLDLQRGEQTDETGNVHDFHRVIVTSPDGSETIHAGPNAQEAVTTAVGSLPDAIHAALAPDA